MLALIEVPKHGDTVLTTGGSEGSIGGDGKRVDVTSVAEVVGLQLALVELPNLYVSHVFMSTSKTRETEGLIRDLGG